MTTIVVPPPPNIQVKTAVPYITVPFIDPPNTFRATTIEQMFDSLFSSNSVFDFIYNVGVPSTYPFFKLLIRNKTMNNDLQINITTPTFVNLISISVPQTNRQFILAKNTTATITFGFIESDAINKSMTNVRIYNQSFIFAAVPLALMGPVFVLDNLPALSF